MGFAGRDLISINDFTNEEIEAVLDLAEEMNSRLEKGEGMELCKGKDMATLFYEPSTRTRGSFERAMHKLGGEVISFAEAKTSSSAAKGETIADTVRVLENYADIIVLRHPWEGAAKVAADYAQVPVINAGDGAHEHPTQTLCDLYTLRREKGKIKGLRVCLWGDLKYGRTVHSLIYALARFGAEVLCAPVQGLDMPEAVLKGIRSEYNCVPCKVKPDDLNSMMGEVDVIYITPFKPYNLALWPDLNAGSPTEINIREALEKTDVVYVTRVQTERRTKVGDTESVESYPIMNGQLLREFKKKPLVMHPLPRVNELAYELDKYPRSVYFRQAAYGVPIRMALIALLLGASELEVPQSRCIGSLLRKIAYERYKEVFGVRCPNPNCVSNHERESRYLVPEFKMLKGEPLTLRCVYCDYETHPPYIASSEWHEGKLENKRYYSSDSFMLGRIKPKNLIIFGSESEAQARGFKRSQYATSPKKVRRGGG
ncbi:MAG: aspartate carbamoyltransferase [Dehalococcoidia bacterium]|nr:aspartate carbamoyltransferase [Dehalococcoidia bacterium]